MTGRGQSSSWLWPVVACATVGVAILPMLLVRHLPLVDFPNHLARFEVRDQLAAGSVLARFYSWHWAFIPTLGLDLLMLPLHVLLPVEPAGNLALTLALILLCVGTMAVDTALHGHRRGLSLFAGILLYNGAFRFGFASFIIGVSCALLLFALWLRRRPCFGVTDMAGFGLACVALILVHLYAFGLYAVCVAGYEVSLLAEAARAVASWRWPPMRRSLLVGLTLALPPLALLASPTSHQAGVTRWSGLEWKIEALVSPIYFDQPRVELPLLLLVGATIGGGLLTGTIRLHRSMAPAMIGFAALVLLLPRMLFGSNYADYRLLSGAGFFFLASLRLETTIRWRARTMVTLLGLCLIIRVGSVAAEWVRVQPVMADYDHALDPVPAGARLLVIHGDVEPRSARRSPPLEHVPVLAAARRQVFTAYIFADRITPLHLRPAYESYAYATPDEMTGAELDRYDYVLAVQDPDIAIPDGITLVPVGHGRTYVLSRIDRH